MATMRTAGVLLQRVLETITVSLLVILAGVVVSAVVARYAFNSSFHWYDEVASVMLAWITYFGAALAALRRQHLGFSGVVMSLGKVGRGLCFAVSEVIIYVVFGAMAWAGWYVLGVMAGETLVSLDWVPLQFTQSVVPIGCALFILAQVLSTPEAWRRLMAGRDVEAEEIEHELAKAAEHAEQGGARR